MSSASIDKSKVSITTGKNKTIATEAFDNSPTILVVEDNDDILYMISTILRKNSFNVHGFNNPAEAVEHVRGGCREGITILSDVHMPEIEGPKLVEQIKRMRPEMKVIMMSSDTMQKEDFKGILSPSVQVDDFLQKPFSVDELLLKIKQSIR